MQNSENKHLWGRCDLNNLTFHLMLPTFSASYRKNLSKRIVDYGGHVVLNIKKADNLIVVISDNLQEVANDNTNNQLTRSQPVNTQGNMRHNQPIQSQNWQRDHVFRELNENSSSASNRSRQIYRNFISSQLNNERNETQLMIDKLQRVIAMGTRIVKITELHRILDYYDSFTKFEWHTRRDECRMLRALVNEQG